MESGNGMDRFDLSLMLKVKTFGAFHAAIEVYGAEWFGDLELWP